MRNATTAAAILLAIALGLLLAGAYPAAAFLALSAGLVVVTEPSEAHRDARRRNQARPR